MITNISKLLNDIEFGNLFDAFIAAKKIANKTLSQKDIDILDRVAEMKFTILNRPPTLFFAIFTCFYIIVDARDGEYPATRQLTVI